MKQIKQTIEAFVKGGDTNDKELLDKVVHPAYQNIQDGFFKEKGVYVISKTEYLDLVDKKTFGGSPRTIHYESLEQMGNIAIAKVVLESKYLKFFSTIVSVFESDRWLVISNIPIVEIKEPIA